MGYGLDKDCDADDDMSFHLGKDELVKIVNELDGVGFSINGNEMVLDFGDRSYTIAARVVAENDDKIYTDTTADAWQKARRLYLIDSNGDVITNDKSDDSYFGITDYEALSLAIFNKIKELDV